jgi:hypothetical protein
MESKSKELQEVRQLSQTAHKNQVEAREKIDVLQVMTTGL